VIISKVALGWAKVNSLNEVGCYVELQKSAMVGEIMGDDVT